MWENFNISSGFKKTGYNKRVNIHAGWSKEKKGSQTITSCHTFCLVCIQQTQFNVSKPPPQFWVYMCWGIWHRHKKEHITYTVLVLPPPSCPLEEPHFITSNTMCCSLQPQCVQNYLMNNTLLIKLTIRIPSSCSGLLQKSIFSYYNITPQILVGIGATRYKHVATGKPPPRSKT